MAKKDSATGDQAQKRSSRPTVSVYEAKTHFSRLVRRVASGEEIVVTRGGQPVIRLVPYASDIPRRVLGRDAGKVEIAEDFDAPLPGDLLEQFES